MSINFQAALGIHEQALQLREQRNQVLGTNIANADTPGYQARDFDFRAALDQAAAAAGSASTSADAGSLTLAAPQGGGQGAATLASAGTALDGSASASSPKLMYRHPFQPSLDGNTVEGHVEETQFAENAMHYQATLTFLGSQFSALKTAINGS